MKEELTYTYSWRGNSEACHELLPLARNLLRMADEERVLKGSSSNIKNLGLDNGNSVIRVLSDQSGNNIIHVESSYAEEEEEVAFESRHLLIHCYIELDVIESIPNYTKDPSFITVEPLPEKTETIPLHVLYDATANRTVKITQPGLYEKEIDLLNFGNVLVGDSEHKVSVTYEDAKSVIEHETEYEYVDKTESGFFTRSSSYQYDTADIRTLDDVDPAIFEGDDNGYVATFDESNKNYNMLYGFKRNHPISVSDITTSFTGHLSYNASLSLALLGTSTTKNSWYPGFQSITDSSKLQTASENAFYINTELSEVLSDFRHLPKLGMLIDDEGNGLTRIEHDRYLDGTVVTREYTPPVADYCAMFPYSVEMKYENGLRAEYEDIAITDSWYCDRRAAGNICSIETFINYYQNFSIYKAGNYLLLPVQHKYWPENLTNIEGSNDTITQDNALANPSESKPGVPNSVTICTRSFFANTENPTGLLFDRKEYYCEWNLTDTYDQKTVDGDIYVKRTYNPLHYSIERNNTFDVVPAETSPPLNNINSPAFATVKGDLVSIDLLSSVYVSGSFGHTELNDLDLSMHHDPVDLEYATDWIGPGDPFDENSRPVVGKRPWPRFLDNDSWSYHNVYGVSCYIGSVADVLRQYSLIMYEGDLDVTNDKNNLFYVLQNNHIENHIANNENIYDFDDTLNSSIVNSIYEVLDKRGYDRHAVMADVRIKADLYDKYIDV